MQKVILFTCTYVTCFIRPRTGPIPAALNPPKDNSICVCFSAVLPKSAWEWDDNSSSVYIRFMRADLGKDAYDVGPGTIARYG